MAPPKGERNQSESALVGKKIEIAESIKAELDSGGSLKSAKEKLSQLYPKELVNEVFDSFSRESLRQGSSQILSKYGAVTVEKPEIITQYLGPTFESIIVAGAVAAIALLVVYISLVVVLAVFVGK